MTKKRILLAIAILLPIFSFYGLTARETVNLPFLDDYSGVFGFLNSWVVIGTIRGRVTDVFLSQHNEYKLIFAQTVFVLQYLLAGKVNFAVLSTFGNLLVLPLAVILYGMWKADRRDIKNRLLIFVPVSWVFFQFQYYSLLNWPMSSLQHVAVILFSLLTIYLISRNDRRCFYLSLLSLAFAIASSGNGFFVAPIGCIVLLQFKQVKRMVLWIVASALMVAVYFHGYDFNQSQAHADHSIVSSIYHLSPVYALSFLGASVARYNSFLPAAALGLLIVAVFLMSVRDKLYIDNPGLFYSMGFILITSIAVSGLRSDLGVSQSLVSRYRMYSNLSVIFVYLYLAEKIQGRIHSASVRRFVFIAIMGIAVAFNLGSDYAGFKLLRIRTNLTVEGVCRWQRGNESLTTAIGPENEDPVIKRQRLNGNYAPLDLELRPALALGIYSLPEPQQSCQ